MLSVFKYMLIADFTMLCYDFVQTLFLSSKTS